jgi:hypothetical protein
MNADTGYSECHAELVEASLPFPVPTAFASHPSDFILALGILFVLFADDNCIFPLQAFELFLRDRLRRIYDRR